MSAPVEIRLRRLDSADAPLLAELGARLFRETFAAGRPPADMDAYIASAFGESLQRRELDEAGSRAFVAENESGAAVGYAQLAAPNNGGSASNATTVEIVRFYVDRRWHGRGIAQRLMRECIAEAERCGATTIQLGVWQENARAIAFYRKFGFRPVATQTFRLGTLIEHDWVMARPVAASLDPPSR